MLTGSTDGVLRVWSLRGLRKGKEGERRKKEGEGKEEGEKEGGEKEGGEKSGKEESKGPRAAEGNKENKDGNGN